MIELLQEFNLSHNDVPLFLGDNFIFENFYCPKFVGYLALGFVNTAERSLPDFIGQLIECRYGLISHFDEIFNFNFNGRELFLFIGLFEIYVI